MKIEQIEIKNFKAFKHAVMKDIPNLCVVVGANGTGKSTLFDVFGFLRHSFEYGLSSAVESRGGFLNLRTRGESESLVLTLKVLDNLDNVLYIYSLEFDFIITKPQIVLEYLDFQNKNCDTIYRLFENKQGALNALSDDLQETKSFNLAKKDVLGLSTLSQFESYSKIIKIADYFRAWHISVINIDEARKVHSNFSSELLSKNADNLNYILHGIYTKNQRVFETIIGKLKSYIPSISTVETKVNDEGKILLSFQDGNFVEPFSASVVSDGTIKVLAFLVLIYSMDYHSLLCIEEPENQLYPKLLVELAEEFRLYANKGGQVFVSTHSPDFLNAMKIEEVFWLEKKSGYTGIKRAFDNEQLKIYMENGDQMGYLWTQGFFEEVDTI